MFENQIDTERAFNPPPTMDFNLPPVGRHEKEISPLSRKFAIFLCLFAGAVSAHDFYLGYTKKGITKIVLYLLIVGGFINPVWTLVDLFNLIFKSDYCDAQGRVLQ